MLIPSNIFDIVKNVHDELKKRDQYNFPLRVGEHIIPIVEEISGYKINIEKRAWTEENTKQFRSDIRKYHTPGTPHRAEILYSDSMNPCWVRFSVCKELSHLLFDNKDNATLDIHQTFSVLADDFPYDMESDQVSRESKIYESEKMAELIALEILFPYEWRHLIDVTTERGYFDVEPIVHANKFLIPTYYVTRGLNPRYLDSIKAAFPKDK